MSLIIKMLKYWVTQPRIFKRRKSRQKLCSKEQVSPGRAEIYADAQSSPCGTSDIGLIEGTKHLEQRCLEAWQWWRDHQVQHAFGSLNTEMSWAYYLLSILIRIESEAQTVWVCSQSTLTSRAAGSWQTTNPREHGRGRPALEYRHLGLAHLDLLPSYFLQKITE